ncbi:hypothetical protein [Vibrio phage vB_VpaP_SJSY21]|nr:hypothetical protein [Vibrio phage vB_VpaP_SJSY21]
MLNSFSMNSTGNVEQDVMSLVMGCEKFLDRHTGDVPDGATPEQMSSFLINSAGMISNDLHYLDVGGNGTPSGTSTTETQSIHILGYIYLYKATGNTYFLDRAKYFWQAYFDVFYLGQTVPTAPQEFRCHWMVNAKQPFDSAYPINWDQTSHSGWKGVEFMVTDNVLKVPDDTTYFGKLLQKVTYAFRSTDILIWDSIAARVTETNWDNPGHIYEVEWFINYQGYKLDPGGDRVDDVVYPESDKGTVKLSGKVFLGEVDGEVFEDGKIINEIVKLNFCTNNGVEIGRNEPFDPRPLWTPLRPGWQGNASDAEQWFGDACYQMWEITGEEKYNIMHKCVVETCKGYADIDRGQLYWRRNEHLTTPYTDGINYIYSSFADIPDKNAFFYRNRTTGFNEVDLSKVPSDGDGDREIIAEQQAVWYKANADTEMVLEGVSEQPCNQEVTFSVNKVKTDNDSISPTKWFRLGTDSFTTVESKKRYKLTEALEADTDSLFFDASGISIYGGNTPPNIVAEQVTAHDILGNISDSYLKATWTNREEVSYYDGFWHNLTVYGTTTKQTEFKKVTFKIEHTLPEAQSIFADWEFTLTDVNDVETVAKVPYSLSNGEWVTVTAQDLFGVASVPNLKSMTVDLVDFVNFQNFGPYSVTISLYALNDVPTKYDPSVHGEYTIMHRIKVRTTGDTSFKYGIGDVYLDNYSDDNLAYTPGMIPFSNNFNPDTGQYDSWQGMPYMGYQYGWIWKDDPLYWHNVKDVLYDSQVSYGTRHKWEDGTPVVGPCSSGYVWNRWDNTGYGEIDTFVDTFWGTAKPWDGYQPRAFLAIARMYEHASKYPTPEISVDTKLEEMSNKWVDFLYQFQLDNDGKFPDYYPKDNPDAGDLPYPASKWDFVGHMVANYLTGACKLAMSGLSNPHLEELCDKLYADIHRNYFVGDPGFHMNGCWSEWPQGGQFFGFWAGDIYKALGSYIMFNRWRRSNG